MTTPEPGPAVTVAEACKQIGVGKTKFYELVSLGEITTFTLPSRTGERRARRVKQAEIDAFLNRNRQTATP